MPFNIYSTLPIDFSGKIECMLDNVYEHHLQASKALSHAVKIVFLKDEEFLLPGFIDTRTVTRLICSRDLLTRFRSKDPTLHIQTGE